MALAQTKAATYIQEHTEEISSHQVISLLMDGALERAEQAKLAFKNNEQEDLLLLLGKLIAIINGLKNCLNLNAGGEIADNLNGLYEYMIQKISNAQQDDLMAGLEEVSGLISEIKGGWDNMTLSELDLSVAVAE